MNNTEPPPVASNNSPELCIRISFRASGTPTALFTLTGKILKSNLKLLSSAFNECLINEKDTFILDMKKVDVVSSAGWKFFVAEQNRLKSKDVTLLLFGLQPQVYTVFTGLQLKDEVRVFPTIEECQKEIELISAYQKKVLLKETSQTFHKPHSLEIDTEKDTVKPDSKLRQSIPDEDKEISKPGDSVPEKIATIISLHGPCSVLKILSYLHSAQYENEKIGLFGLFKILNAMNLESKQKRLRFFRSC